MKISPVRKIVDWFIVSIGKIHWKFKSGLTQTELEEIRGLLVPNYYIILTHRRNHLSTFFVGLASFVLTGRWGYWAHALMNLEDEVNDINDFRLVEATGKGVHYSTFEESFDVHGVALLRPKSMSLAHWVYVMDKAKTELGKPYDSLFDLSNDQSLSCVELVRTALMAEPNYHIDFANFENLIKNRKNLTPQMFYECDDFIVVHEIRH